MEILGRKQADNIYLEMQSRRKFIGKVATGLAGSFAGPAILSGANERIRIGLLGCGERGLQILRDAAVYPGVVVAALADIYPRRLGIAGAEFPNARQFSNPSGMLESGLLDAVLIATPQHLHAGHFIASIGAGLHVYQENTMAFTLDDAKTMRAAYEQAAEKRVVQIGHQACSSGQIADARQFSHRDYLGKITSINAHMFRNTPFGKPQGVRPIGSDLELDSSSWSAFLGSAPATQFDANRFVNWRLFSDYSSGNVHENMCHQLAFWYKMLDLQIPNSAQMSGGIFLWNDGRQVPDTMSVSLHQNEGFLFNWNCGLGNNEFGIGESVLGTHGTILRGQQIRYAPQKVNRRDATEQTGLTPTTPRAHMQNFLDAIRLGIAPSCPFELGYRVSIACRMAVDSYLQCRTVYWDSTREEII